MAAPIAIQLYTVREALAKNFKSVVTRISEIGYVGVETAGFPGVTVEEAGDLFADLGLEVCSMHSQLPLGKQKNQIIEMAHQLEVNRVVTSTPRQAFESMDALKELCDRWNQASQIAEENGLELGLHNHWWEFTEVEGRPGFEILVEKLDEKIFFQVDTYWVNTGGGDSVAVVEELGERAPLLHIKDGPLDSEKDMQAVGEGAMDIPPIIEASHGTCDWLIVEIDRCGADMMEAVENSYDYLVGNELARGAR